MYCILSEKEGNAAFLNLNTALTSDIRFWLGFFHSFRNYFNINKTLEW